MSRNNIWRKSIDTSIKIISSLSASIGIVFLVWILFEVIRRGAASLSIQFFTQASAPPGIEGGGVGNAILGTLIITTLATIIGVPIGVMSGVYLAALARTEDRPETQAQPVAIRKWLPMAVIAGLCWTTSFSFMKVVLEDIDPIIANSFRLPLASLLLTSLVLPSGQRKSLKVTSYRRRTLGLVAASGILSYGIGVLLELNAIRYAGMAKATILTSWTPLFVLFLSALFLRERITLRLGLGTLLCSGGTVLLMVL